MQVKITTYVSKHLSHSDSLVYEAGVLGMQAHPKTFDLVKIRAKSVEILAKCLNTFAKSLYML